MQNHRSSRVGKAVAVVGGLALLAGVASADLRYSRGFVYVDTDTLDNGPSGEDDHIMDMVRNPKQGADSLRTGVQPFGDYDMNCRFIDPKLRLGDTMVFRTLDLSSPGESARVVVPIDSSLLIPGDSNLIHILYVPSVIAQDTSRSNRTFCIGMGGVIDTSGTSGALKYAYFGENTDTIIDNIPPYPDVAYDSVRADLQRLNRDIGHLEPVHLVFYKGELSDTTSAFTDTVVHIQRQIGSFKNDAMRIPDMIYPKTVLGVHEYTPPQKPQHKRIQSPCHKADLERYIQENNGNVEVFDVSGRKVRIGGYNETPPGAYLLRQLYRLGHAKHEENFIGTQKVVVTK